MVIGTKTFLACQNSNNTPDFSSLLRFVACDTDEPVKSLQSTVDAAVPALLFVACAFVACQAPPPEPDPFELEVAHRPGGVLNSPVASMIDREATSWSVTIELERFDAIDLRGEPIAERIERALVLPGEEPLRTRGELAAGVVAMDAPPTETPRWAREEHAFLWPGSTVVWSARPVGDPMRSTRERFGLELGRPLDADHLELAVVFEGSVAPRIDEDELDEDEPVPVLAPVARTERLILDPLPATDGVALRLLVPSPRPLLPDAAELVTVRIERGDATPVEAAYQAALADLEAEAESAKVVLPETERLLRREREKAVEALEGASPERQALLFLADASGSDLALDLALVATDDTLFEYQVAMRKVLVSDEASAADTAAFGWIFERASWTWLAKHLADETHEPAPELRAMMLRRAGEAGSSPDVVLELIEGAHGLADLERLLVEENRILLEDGRPAARVRAYDWLALRESAPPEFDPLAPRAERRAVLKALEKAAEAAAEKAGDKQ